MTTNIKSLFPDGHLDKHILRLALLNTLLGRTYDDELQIHAQMSKHKSLFEDISATRGLTIDIESEIQTLSKLITSFDHAIHNGSKLAVPQVLTTSFRDNCKISMDDRVARTDNIIIQAGIQSMSDSLMALKWGYESSDNLKNYLKKQVRKAIPHSSKNWINNCSLELKFGDTVFSIQQFGRLKCPIDEYDTFSHPYDGLYEGVLFKDSKAVDFNDTYDEVDSNFMQMLMCIGFADNYFKKQRKTNYTANFLVNLIDENAVLKRKVDEDILAIKDTAMQLSKLFNCHYQQCVPLVYRANITMNNLNSEALSVGWFNEDYSVVFLSKKFGVSTDVAKKAYHCIQTLSKIPLAS